LHEIGHNWDTESPIWGDFLNLSAWTQTDPNSPQYQKIEKYGETWWYNTNAAFASNYAQTHPLDDFAESFAAYFSQTRENLAWYNPRPGGGGGASDIPDKIKLIDQWVVSV